MHTYSIRLPPLYTIPLPTQYNQGEGAAERGVESLIPDGTHCSSFPKQGRSTRQTRSQACISLLYLNFRCLVRCSKSPAVAECQDIESAPSPSTFDIDSQLLDLSIRLAPSRTGQTCRGTIYPPMRPCLTSRIPESRTSREGRWSRSSQTSGYQMTAYVLPPCWDRFRPSTR